MISPHRFAARASVILNAEDMARDLADRMNAHIAEGRAVAWCRSMRDGWTPIKTAVADGPDVIVTGGARLRVHVDPALNEFSTYWWTPQPGVIPALMRERL